MPTELKSEYKRVRFKCDFPKAPEHFFIITAYNPDGITAGNSANEQADQLLQSEITQLGCEQFPVIGGSPDFAHSESGYGLSCSRGEALSLARQFHQEALFEVKHNKVILISALVDPIPDEEIGKWSELCCAGI